MGKTIRNYNNDGLKSIKTKRQKRKSNKVRVEDYIDYMDNEFKDEGINNQSNEEDYPYDD